MAHVHNIMVSCWFQSKRQVGQKVGAVLRESKVDFGQIIGAIFGQVSGRIWKPFVVKEI